MNPENYNHSENTTNAAALTKEEKNWAMFCHLSGLSGAIIPFGNIVGPLIIWTIKRDEMPFVNDQGMEALNFQISVTIYLFASLILLLIVVGFFLLIAVGFFGTIFAIIAAVKAADGVNYRYPLTIRFVK
jgi:uncharacterized Tic20 family protein